MYCFVVCIVFVVVVVYLLFVVYTLNLTTTIYYYTSLLLQHICAAFEDIDGRHDVVGYARPLLLRSSGPHRTLAVTGEMVFDKADVHFDDFPDVILHEMGHVLGIGTLWHKQALVSGSGSRCVYRQTSKASNEYRCLSGCRNRAIPLGHKCSHWAESCFGDELLTSRSDNDMYLSRLTVAALEDLGYLVNYNGADSTMTKNSLSSSCRCNRRLGELVERPAQQRKLSDAQLAAEQRAKDFGMGILQQDDLETTAQARSSGSSEVEAANVVSVFYKDPDTDKVVHTIVRGDI